MAKTIFHTQIKCNVKTCIYCDAAFNSRSSIWTFNHVARNYVVPGSCLCDFFQMTFQSSFQIVRLHSRISVTSLQQNMRKIKKGGNETRGLVHVQNTASTFRAQRRDLGAASPISRSVRVLASPARTPEPEQCRIITHHHRVTPEYYILPPS